jgi:cytochrome c5
MWNFMRAALLLVAALVAGMPAATGAQTAPAKPAAAPEASGKEILQRKCFQCHAASMWTSLRQERKAWEGVLYRMVGRGALWTEAEIAAMADFLAQTRGPVK